MYNHPEVDRIFDSQNAFLFFQQEGWLKPFPWPSA